MAKAKSSTTKQPTTKKRRKSSPLISKDVYDQMLRAYFERQSIAYVARVCPVSYTTAKKYVNKGDSRRKLMSLRDRWTLTNDQQRQQEDYDLARMRTEVQTAARAMFRKVVLAIQACDPESLTADKLVEQLAKVQTILERTFGEAEHTHEVKGAFAGWTPDDLVRFIKDGVTPPGM